MDYETYGKIFGMNALCALFRFRLQKEKLKVI